jgi:DNA repair protein RadD
VSFEDRKYQKDAVNGIWAAWRNGHKRVLLVSSTGSGKGSIACMIIEWLLKNNWKIAVLAHRRILVKTLAERLMSFGIPYTVLMANLPDEPWVRHDDDPRVFICSKDTLLSMCSGGRWSRLPEVELVLIDECHRGDEETYAELLENFPAKHALGMTATPLTPDGEGLGTNKWKWDCLVQSTTVRGLTEQGYLVPLKVFSPPGVGRRRRDGDRTTGIAGDPVQEWKDHAEGGRTVAFLRTVAEAREVAKRFEDAGIPSAVLSAKSDNEERTRVLDLVREGKILWLGNVNLFVEGADMPELVCCQLLRRFGSLQGYIQAVGRVLRPCKNLHGPGDHKKYGILLDQAGAFLEYRYPELEIEWRLGESERAFKKRLKKEKETQLSAAVQCLKCGGIFAGMPVCPHCGEPVPVSKKRTKPKWEQERLALASGGEYGTKTALQMQWDRVIAMARANRWKVKQASGAFFSATKMYPDKAGVIPQFGRHENEEILWDVILKRRQSRSGN